MVKIWELYKRFRLLGADHRMPGRFYENFFISFVDPFHHKLLSSGSESKYRYNVTNLENRFFSGKRPDCFRCTTGYEICQRNRIAGLATL